MRIIAAVLLAAIILSIPGTGAEAQPRGQVVVALSAIPGRLLGATEAVAAYVFMLVHDTLARVDESGTVLPRLAESWERSADGRTHTVRLRQAKFQDGRPVTAEDVKFSFEFNLHPRFPWRRDALLEIEGGQEYKDGKASEVTGIRVADPRTVRLTLKRRYAFFATDIMGAVGHYIMPKHALAGIDLARMVEHPYNRRPVGAGPYRLTEWRDREHMTFQAFTDYWGSRPSVARIIWRQIPEPATVMAEVRAGSVDAGQILPDEVESFRANPRLSVLQFPGDAYYAVGFNHQHPLLGDRRVREAFAHAIDREAMVRTLMKGYGRVANSVLHPSLWQHNAGLAGYPYDPERARRLLREAGFAPGPGGMLQRDGQPLRLRYTFVAAKVFQDQALMVQQFMRQVGVEIVLEPMDRGAFFAQMFRPGGPAGMELTGLSWFNLIQTVQSELNNSYHRTGLLATQSRYASREMDALLEQAATAPERGTLRTIYFRMQAAALQDIPWLITVRPDELWAVKRQITTPRIRSLAAFFRSMPEWKLQ
ncbi:MAG: ABC transporter substrate-binding protein [Armatimonadetes bacterium]|nr:ABC transporter substrate-binding protein [Armatimonadota bacterium]